MSLFQTHLWAIIGLLTGIAGLSTLLDNATFTSSLSNAMPSALATQVITRRLASGDARSVDSDVAKSVTHAEFL